ncbi:hypothetical protein M5K25_023678 [Dendrobium thyrsiflorum]|uniref:Uncharacterized protein n=1 Tax=Dendrobium thyrsiflorum TaxID=117978 RepID=A0ABD0UFJ3_DENTH
MADPEVDHGFLYDSQGRVDILLSPFFDPNWEIEDTVDDYVDRILYQLTETIDEQRPAEQRKIVGRPLAPSPPANFPLIKIVGFLCFSVASLGKSVLPYLKGKKQMEEERRLNTTRCTSKGRSVIGRKASTTRGPMCMGDPNVDHGFSYDDQGRVDVLHSPFFDVAFGNDTTADEYVERVLYQLTLAIEDQLPASRWCLVSRRPSPPTPATSPATSTRGIPLLLVASLLVASLLLRPFA